MKNKYNNDPLDCNSHYGHREQEREGERGTPFKRYVNPAGGHSIYFLWPASIYLRIVVLLLLLL